MTDDLFNHSLAALRFAHLANGVSQLHGEVSRQMWDKYDGICEIKAITNAQNWRYWADKQLYRARRNIMMIGLMTGKDILKKERLDIVADQTGKLMDPNVLDHCLGKKICRI